jgi:alpha-tubulin suppressor-like RCC1 family protein
MQMPFSVRIAVFLAVTAFAVSAQAQSRVRGHNSTGQGVVLATGGTHALLELPNGGGSYSLLGWGTNASGELGSGSSGGNQLTPHDSSDLNDFSQVTAGLNFSAGIDVFGNLWTWGNNSQGQIGNASTTGPVTTPFEISYISWIGIAAGRTHLVGIASTGALWTWGQNTHGELGLGNTTSPLSSPQPISVTTNQWTDVAAGNEFTVGIKADGSLWTWGLGGSGQLGNGIGDAHSPQHIGTSTWTHIAAGDAHVLAIRADGTLWGWGSNSHCQVGNNSNNNVTAPVQITTGAGPWIAVAAGYQHSLAIRADGTLWAWGDNGDGQLGLNSGTITQEKVPTQVTFVSAPWQYISAGDYFSFGITASGSTFGWGLGTSGQLGNGGSTQNHPVQPTWTNTNISSGLNPNTNLTDAKPSLAIAGGWGGFLIRQNGSLFSWGYGGADALGISSPPSQQLEPVQVGSATTWVQIAGGDSQTLALQGNGTLWGWGENIYGEVGNNSTSPRVTPTQIGSSSEWTKVFARQQASFGIRADGTLWAWGYNDSGQLGLNSTSNVSVPTQVTSPSNEFWTEIAPGYDHALGITSDGKLWAAWEWRDHFERTEPDGNMGKQLHGRWD